MMIYNSLDVVLTNHMLTNRNIHSLRGLTDGNGTPTHTGPGGVLQDDSPVPSPGTVGGSLRITGSASRFVAHSGSPVAHRSTPLGLSEELHRQLALAAAVASNDGINQLNQARVSLQFDSPKKAVEGLGGGHARPVLALDIDMMDDDIASPMAMALGKDQR